MASVPPSSWAFSPKLSNSTFSSSKTAFLPPKYTENRLIKSLRISSSSTDSSESTTEEEPESSDPVKLAFAKAEAYRKSKISKPIPERNPTPESIDVTSKGSGDSVSEVPASDKLAMEKSKEYQKNKRIMALEQNPVSESTNFAKESGDPGPEVPDSIELAMEKAREYKKNNGVIVGGARNIAKKTGDSGLQKMKVGNNIRDGVLDIKVGKGEEPTISSTDFLGLDFSDKKKNRGTPAGLVPFVDTFAEENLPEVEFIVGDASKFEPSRPSKSTSNEDDSNTGLYKPKVSTWGVFPRPSNISKTFGGGRNIHPGEVLETAEAKTAKEARTRQLIASYKNKMGLNIDVKTKCECEKALKEGDYLMDLGKLREALPYYEKVMKELVFQSDLHGVAALQWSVCQDSLNRPNEARIMYEKLQSHPNVQVSKKARQFMFGFQAMEMMKISSFSYQRTGYENYFEAFLENKADYTPTEEDQDEGALRQVLPYIIFLLSPIIIVLIVAVRKGLEF